MHEIEELSLREISRQTGFHRDTIKKSLESKHSYSINTKNHFNQI